MIDLTRLADRISDFALAVLAALNLLFLLALATTLLLLAPAASATDGPECTGRNLVEELAASDPALLAHVRAEASAIPNGQGTLWKIEKDGLEPSWLFGTMHLTDRRVTELTPAAHRAFEDARTVVIETTDVTDPAKAAQSLARHPELTMLTDGSTLTSLMTAEEAEMARKALAERGIPLAGIDRLQPWLVTAMVSLPACETARRSAGMPVLDLMLAREAEKAGKKVEGLETAVSQLRAMASLSREFHVRGLIDTLKLGNRKDDLFETMIALYKAGETGMIWPLFKALQPGDDEGAGLAAFETAMITARNRGMAENSMAHFRQGDAFVAVGALHLPGEDGLVERIRRAGYRVVAVE